MADQNMAEFYTRVARIKRDHSRGYGMEAAGTLGRSYFRRTARPRRSFLGPLLMVLVCAFGLKAALHARIGDTLYNERVAEMSTGEGFDRLGASLMVADPVTLALSAQFTKWGF
jgi:hypothetical protein